jgi:group II intron reverse transcriptase/maturase
MGFPAEGRKEPRIPKQRRTDMQRGQKTMDSFLKGDRTESEGMEGATSIPVAQSVEVSIYDDLILKVIDDGNIEEALRRVVGNGGAPGVDGMTVHELESWIQTNKNELKTLISEDRYIPVPVRRKEIPKPNGGTRNLGIPTAKDRLVQQMVAQVLTPIYDPTFSESSYGFRPGRSAQDAILKVKEYYDEGYTFGVGLDLEKFFDTMNQRYLMNILRERIKDKTLIRLIKRFLRAGVALPNGITEATETGSPQGGPLSPLLSNIYLDRLDKELESRGLHFCRYADDSLIMVKSRTASERVCNTVTRFLEEEMLLKVNREKTEVGPIAGMKYLGFRITRSRGRTYIGPHPKSLEKFKKRVRAITKRNRGVSFEQVVTELRTYIRGWFGYFGISDSKTLMGDLDEWIRHRLRQYVFKKWKNYRTRVKNLVRLSPPYKKGYLDNAVEEDWLREIRKVSANRAYWKASNYSTVKFVLTIGWMREQGVMFLLDLWKKRRETVSTATYRTVCVVV